MKLLVVLFFLYIGVFSSFKSAHSCGMYLAELVVNGIFCGVGAGSVIAGVAAGNLAGKIQNKPAKTLTRYRIVGGGLGVLALAAVVVVGYLYKYKVKSREDHKSSDQVRGGGSDDSELPVLTIKGNESKNVSPTLMDVLLNAIALPVGVALGSGLSAIYFYLQKTKRKKKEALEQLLNEDADAA